MKILYVGQYSKVEMTGTHYVNNRNRTCLKNVAKDKYAELLCEDNSSRLNLITNMVTGYSGSNTKTFSNHIIDYLSNNDVSVIFFGHAVYGKLIKKIRKRFPTIKIIVFFHTVEKSIAIKSLRKRVTKWNIYNYLITIHNEPLAVRYSDIRITLNERDRAQLFETYGLGSEYLLPTSFPIIPISIKDSPPNKELTMLFVGSKFLPNQRGIEWFIDNVMTNLNNVRLVIVGFGMEYLNQCKNIIDKVTVIGGVDDISEWYCQSDLVVCPIFEGGGMKTKTAQAMQYGKPIIGTSEAWEGYDVDFNRIGALCNTSTQFIDAINHFEQNRDKLVEAAKYSNRVFVDKYSTNSAVETIQKIINQVLPR